MKVEQLSEGTLDEIILAYLSEPDETPAPTDGEVFAGIDPAQPLEQVVVTDDDRDGWQLEVEAILRGA